MRTAFVLVVLTAALLAGATGEATARALATSESSTPAAATGEPPSRAPATNEPSARAPATNEPSSRAPATDEPPARAPATGEATARAAATGDEGLVPPDGFLGEWKQDGKTEVYPGEALYDHIDGAGELFLEFGFEAVTVQRYRAGDDELLLEIHRMTDQQAALGVYLMKCGREVRDPAFAPRHTIGQFQLTFQKGRYFVIATCPQGRGSRRPALLGFGGFVADRVEGDKPLAILKLLPQDGLIESSLRLIRGPYALQSLITLGEGDVLGLGGKITAIAADYQQRGGTPSTRLVVEYPSHARAAGNFARLRAHLDPQLRIVKEWGSRFEFVDQAGKYGVASFARTRLTIVFGLGNPNVRDSAV